jgi:serine/threonine protein phosphatase PrpC
MTILYAGLTDIGQKRKTNQDSICLAPDLNFYAVADGMGGHNGGDIASQMAAKILPEFLSANKDLESNEELKGMGTTIVSLLIDGGDLFIGNVGDSRAYLVSNKKIYQLTKDHSLVQEKLSLGIYNRSQAKEDPQKNVLIRTVGYEPDVEVDSYKYKIQVNDLFLLCSDGLSGKVHDQDIVRLANDALGNISDVTQEDLNTLAQKLIDLANANGGQDNISVILVLIQNKGQ